MARADEVEAFWREFCRLHGVPTDARHDVFAFGDNPALIDELLALVLHGPKRATASLLTEFETKGEPLPPTPESGMGYGNPDKTKHKKKQR